MKSSNNTSKTTLNSSRQKGDVSEDIASAYLKAKGYQIRKKNFSFGKVGEIDIICEKDEILVFVEVKSRYNRLGPPPILAITKNKQKSIRKAAEGYLYINNIQNTTCRFDAILIEHFNQEFTVEHLENIM